MPRLRDWVPSLLLLADLGEIEAMYAVKDGVSRRLEPSSFDAYLATQAELNSAVIDAALDAAPEAFAVHEAFTRRYVPTTINVKTYGAVGDGVTDDSAAIADAMDAAAATDGCDVFFPPGIYKTTVAGCTFAPFDYSVQGRIALVPSFTRVYGIAGQSVIYQTGVPQVDGTDPTDQYVVLGIEDGSEQILIEDLVFRGDNDPFTYVLNNQAAAVDVLLTTTHDITVRHCRFENLWGFSFHDRGENVRIHAYGNEFFECANGLNVNASRSIQSHNVFQTSEGIECSGRDVAVVGNVFIDVLGVAISMGGAGNSAGQLTGVQVIGNTINGSTGSGIRMGDNIVGAVIAGNTVKGCPDGAYSESGESFGPGDGPAPRNCVFMGNSIHGNCSGFVGVAVALVGEGHVFTGNNVFVDDDDPAFDQKIAIDVAGSDCTLTNNYLDGSIIDMTVQNTAERTFVAGNVYKNATQNWEAGGTSSFRSEMSSVKTGTDVLLESRIAGEGISRFTLNANGKIEMGSGSGGRDVELSRVSANVLATGADDVFRAAVLPTGARPSAVTVGEGSQMFDSTLNKPIWSDGAVWRDAAGTAV